MDIVGIMEEWARWMTQRNFHGWPTKTILGRCLDDMPTTKCTTCDGRGKLSGHEVGSTLQFIVCDVCKGKGKIPMTASASKINPAMIGGTERFARIPKVQFNFIAHKVDLVVQNSLTGRQKDVVYVEYREPGNQHKKAKILGINQRTYSDHLIRAHTRITKALTAR